MKSKGIKIKDFLYLLLAENYKIQRNLQIENEDVFGMINLQIQKLTYFIQGLFMAKFQEKIIDEKFKAWKYGPVLEEMYYFLKEYGKSYVGKDNFKDFTTEKIAEIEKSFTKEQLEFIEKVFIYFNKYSALELVTISHVEGPWKETNYGEEISDDAILSYFHEKLKQIEQLI